MRTFALTSFTASSASPLPAESPLLAISGTHSDPVHSMSCFATARFKSRIAGSPSLMKT